MSEKTKTFESGAVRNNIGKLRLDLVPHQLKESVAEVLTKGLDDYPERNWEKGIPFMDMYGSIERHWLAFQKREDIDKKSGLHTLKHLACNIAMLLYYIDNNRTDLDNRPCKQTN